jgi:O-6-methylguanine DNA methyltransferase
MRKTGACRSRGRRSTLSREVETSLPPVIMKTAGLGDSSRRADGIARRRAITAERTIIMKQTAYCLFETPLGACGIAWKEQEASRIPPVVTFFQLPEATRSVTDARIAGSSGGRKAGVPPPHIAGIIGKVQKHLGGDAQDFLDIVVDLDAMGPFSRQVYEAVRNIPAGRTRTYGELAADMNRPTASRAVGQALGRNPIPLIIPCHRVLAIGNKPGGFSAHGGVETKARLLEIEGATIGRRRRGHR